MHRQYHRTSCDVPSFDMLVKGLKDCLTVKQAMIITDLTCLKKIVKIACFQIYGIIKQFVHSRSPLNGDFRWNWAANTCRIPKKYMLTFKIVLISVSQNEFLIL